MPRKAIPRYCLHKGSGQAYVKLDGKRHYLGVYGSEESRGEYTRLIGQWQRRQDGAPKGMTVGQLCLLFIEHADGYYQRDGKPTGEADNFRKSAKHLNALFRTLPVKDFGPKRLLEVRQRMIDDGVVRKSINRHIARLKHVFKWGVSQELVSAEVYTALSTVSGLREGRTQAKEGEPVEPVPEEDLQATIPLMTRNVSAICRLLLLTGARVSEIRLMRVGDIDTTGEVWLCRPGSHKNAWRGKDRTIFVGPQGQKILMPFIGDAVQGDQFVFRPRPAENSPYTLRGLESSIRKACLKAGVTPWGPGRLRHNAATIVNREFGDIDAARIVLGHSEMTTTQVYALKDLEKAAEIVKQIG